MGINLFKTYGVIVGIFTVLFGMVLLFLKKLDTVLTDKNSTKKDIRTKRSIIGIIAIIAGMMSLSAILLGWPPIKGYLIPPPSINASASEVPRSVSQQEVAAILKRLPNHVHFSISGLCFYNNKLYASTNIGLLEIENGISIKSYKWFEEDDVIEGPWFDAANSTLWLLHDHTGRLICFNGSKWMSTSLPKPNDGYMRGDILKGFRGSGNGISFWLEGGRTAWIWDNNKRIWRQELNRPTAGDLVRIIPTRKYLLFVMRHEPLDFLVKEDTFESDTIHYFDSQWHNIANDSGRSFFVEQVVTLNGAAYIRTKRGDILHVTPSKIMTIQAPGFCEALAVTSKGTLLASFYKKGIYEYRKKWNLRFKYPLKEESQHWAYLSESKGQVAFAISAKPNLTKDYKTVYVGKTALWYSDDNTLRHISLSD